MISVIIPVYNAARTLSNCLDSIFNLDYTDFEVIIVDNASSDGTVEEVEQRYKDIKMLLSFYTSKR